MCLRKVKDFELKTNIGYKTFRSKEGKLYSQMFYLRGARGIYPLRRWLHEKDYRTINKKNEKIHSGTFSAHRGKLYEKGFHIFLSKSAARGYSSGVVYKVKFRNVVAKGYEFSRTKVVVAKEMLIMEKVKNR